ncbi:uncharacterized protein LOC144438492 isoform X2 [Glandiceps talaboti]
MEASTQIEGRLPARKSRRSLLPTPRTIQHQAQSPEPVSLNFTKGCEQFQIGDRVCISGCKTGTLKFKGATQFAKGELNGVELDEPAGKHNGTVDGVQYFQCPAKHGIFVPNHKIQLLSAAQKLKENKAPEECGTSTAGIPSPVVPKHHKIVKVIKPQGQSKLPSPKVSNTTTGTSLPKFNRPKTLPTLNKKKASTLKTTQVGTFTKEGRKVEVFTLTTSQTSPRKTSSPERENQSNSKLFQSRKVSPVQNKAVSPGWSGANANPTSTATVTKPTTRLPKIRGRRSFLPRVNYCHDSTFTTEDGGIKLILPDSLDSESSDTRSIDTFSLEDSEIQSTTQIDIAFNKNPEAFPEKDILNGAAECLNETFEVPVETNLIQDDEVVKNLDGTFTVDSLEVQITLNETFDKQNSTFNLGSGVVESTNHTFSGETPQDSASGPFDLETLPKPEPGTPDLSLMSFAEEALAKSTPDQLPVEDITDQPDSSHSQEPSKPDISVNSETTDISKRSVHSPTSNVLDNLTSDSLLNPDLLVETFSEEIPLPKSLEVFEQVRAAEERVLSEAIAAGELQSKEESATEIASATKSQLVNLNDTQTLIHDTGQKVEEGDSVPLQKTSSVLGNLDFTVTSSTPFGKQRHQSLMDEPAAVSPIVEDNNISQSEDAKLSLREKTKSGKANISATPEKLTDICLTFEDSMALPVDIIESHIAQPEQPDENGVDQNGQIESHGKKIAKDELKLALGDLLDDGEDLEQSVPDSDWAAEGEHTSSTDFGHSREADKVNSENSESIEVSITETDTISTSEQSLQHTDSLEVTLSESFELNGNIENHDNTLTELIPESKGDSSASRLDSDPPPELQNLLDTESTAQSKLDNDISPQGEVGEDEQRPQGAIVAMEMKSTEHDTQSKDKDGVEKITEAMDEEIKKVREESKDGENKGMKLDESEVKTDDAVSTKSKSKKQAASKSPTAEISMNGTDRNVTSPHRSVSSTSSRSSRLNSPTGRRGSFDSSRGTSPARSSTETLPKKTYTPSSWRTEKPSSPPESKDKGVISPRRRVDLPILPPKLNFATVRSRIDTGRRPSLKKEEKEGGDSLVKSDSSSRQTKTTEDVKRSSLSTSKGSKTEQSASKGIKPNNRTMQTLKTGAGKTGERERRAKKPKGRSLIPHRNSTSKLRPPQSSTSESRYKSTSAGKSKQASSTAATTSTSSTSKVPVRPRTKAASNLSQVKSAQSTTSASHSATVSATTTSTSVFSKTHVRRGSEHGTTSTSSVTPKSPRSGGRILPPTPSLLPPHHRRSPSLDQSRERRTQLKVRHTPSSVSQPDLVPTSAVSENVSKEIKRLEALCEARTKELTVMKMQFKNGLTGFDAMATLVQYLTQELDAFSCPILSHKLKVLEKEFEEAKEIIAKHEKELSELHCEKQTLSEKYEEDTEKMKTEVDEMKETHKKEMEVLKGQLTEEHKVDIENIEKRLKEEHEAEKEQLAKDHEKQLQKVMSDYASNLQNLKAHHREELSEMNKFQRETNKEIEDKYKQDLSEMKSQHQKQIDDTIQDYSRKIKKITMESETSSRSLRDEVATLNFQCEKFKEKSRVLEETLQKDSDKKVQMAINQYKHLPAEVDSMKTVLELRRKEMQELRIQNNELTKELERIPDLEEQVKRYRAKLEDLNEMVDRKVQYERQLSSEHLVLREHFEKESMVNKRLSRENEELQWKLQNSDGSPITGLTPSSTRSTLSPSPTHNLRDRESRLFSRSSSTESHESGVFPLSPSQ